MTGRNPLACWLSRQYAVLHRAITSRENQHLAILNASIHPECLIGRFWGPSSGACLGRVRPMGMAPRNCRWAVQQLLPRSVAGACRLRQTSSEDVQRRLRQNGGTSGWRQTSAARSAGMGRRIRGPRDKLRVRTSAWTKQLSLEKNEGWFRTDQAASPDSLSLTTTTKAMLPTKTPPSDARDRATPLRMEPRMRRVGASD